MLPDEIVPWGSYAIKKALQDRTIREGFCVAAEDGLLTERISQNDGLVAARTD